VPDFSLIGQSIAEIYPFSIFQDGGHPPSWICKNGNFNCRYGLDGEYASSAKFRADRTIRCRDISIFRFLKMAAVRHLGLLEVQNFNCR